MDEKANATTARTQIRRMALCMTVVGWALGTAVISWRNDRILGSAATLAALNALGGLIAWAIYHTISRRNDGLAIVIMAVFWDAHARRNPTLLNDLTNSIVPLVVMASTSLVVSLLVRYGQFVRESRKGRGQKDSSPLWDAEIDRPFLG
jgi:hypothetical protein